MRNKRNLILISISTLLLFACAYIVTPAPDVTPTSPAAKGWMGLATQVGKSAAGDLHVDIAIRNETADWSAMDAAAGQPATLTGSDGKSVDCATVQVGTGGNRIPPGFQVRGYTGGTKAEPKAQPLFVECKGAAPAPGMKLSIPYSYVTGPLNYYVPSSVTNAKLEIDLDKVASDLTYPVADAAEGLIVKPDAGIDAINKCVLTLQGVQRTDTGLELSWQTKNPGEYPSYVHIGNPPVVGADGIIYGVYESPHLADAPITPAGQTAQWTTKVAVPADAKGLYILVPVESKQQRLFIGHVIDITDK
ncbi:MAG TPA: hypothetical protein VMJ64_06000 [Anaerolineales bacterium]|nr:hypothetical protein [Anaerolineales bacterium]